METVDWSGGTPFPPLEMPSRKTGSPVVARGSTDTARRFFAPTKKVMVMQELMLPPFLKASTAVLDREGNILQVNETWREFGLQNGLRDPDNCVGMNYIEVCRASGAEAPLLKELGDVLAGLRTTMTRWYLCDAKTGARWYLMVGLSRSEENNVVVAHIDLSPLLDSKSLEDLDAERPDLAFTDYAR